MSNYHNNSKAAIMVTFLKNQPTWVIPESGASNSFTQLADTISKKNSYIVIRSGPWKVRYSLLLLFDFFEFEFVYY